jgi:hypothetical protein
MAESPFYLFGIRHHGPGCARSLVAALETLQPDCLLIEGPPEGEAVLSFSNSAAMIPPVALLIFNPDNSQEAAFYPFAEFSPEWQALAYGTRHNIPTRFMDLPLSHSFALQTERDKAEHVLAENNNSASEEELKSDVESEIKTPEVAKTGNDEFDINDPLDWLGRAAGYDSGESWWNHMVEERSLTNSAHAENSENNSLELFAAIREAMVTVRAEAPQRLRSKFENSREILREAFMRKTMRQAQKDGYQRIAVICGAWHLPALENLPSAKADNDLLKALPKTKVTATWVPWSFRNLSFRSGYGAGVDSPEWYQHIWQINDSKKRAIRWLAKAAHLLRSEDIDCSSAHIIEAMRFAESLAALRERPQAGLTELLEGLRTTVCMGNEAPITLIEHQLVIGNRFGEIPSEVPTIPLQRDLEQQQKSLRIKPDATQKILDLDLRNENDLARSHLLHRLHLLNIDWGALNKTGRSTKGSFHEIWTLQWEPKLALDIIHASRFGNSVCDAATAKVIDTAKQSQSLADISQLMNSVLLADLPLAIKAVSQTLENLAATSSDILQLLAAIPPLVQIARYGNVRNTDVTMVAHVLQGLIPRAAIALPSACQALDDEAAKKMCAAIINSQQAIRLFSQDGNTQSEDLTEKDNLLSQWLSALSQIALLGNYHGLISGLATRLLFDTHTASSEQINIYMSKALSIGVDPQMAAAWLEGFLNNSGMILLHDDGLWQLVNQWLTSLNDDYFVRTLPLLRRTFSTFSEPERRQLGERSTQSTRISKEITLDINIARAEQSLPYIRQLLGLSL